MSCPTEPFTAFFDPDTAKRQAEPIIALGILGLLLLWAVLMLGFVDATQALQTVSL